MPNSDAPMQLSRRASEASEFRCSDAGNDQLVQPCTHFTLMKQNFYGLSWATSSHCLVFEGTWSLGWSLRNWECACGRRGGLKDIQRDSTREAGLKDILPDSKQPHNGAHTNGIEHFS